MLRLITANLKTFSDSNTTYIPCAPVSRCFSGTGLHRFTTDPYNCVSGGLVMENLNIGVAPSIHIPLLTESLYEMIETGFENVLMAYNTTGRNIAIGYGYVTNRVIRVIKVQHNATVPYFLLWDIKVPIDSVVTPLNEEYNNLKSVFWDTAAADFYMFPPKPRAGSCDLFQSTTVTYSNTFVITVISFILNFRIYGIFDYIETTCDTPTWFKRKLDYCFYIFNFIIINFKQLN